MQVVSECSTASINAVSSLLLSFRFCCHPCFSHLLPPSRHQPHALLGHVSVIPLTRALLPPFPLILPWLQCIHPRPPAPLSSGPAMAAMYYAEDRAHYGVYTPEGEQLAERVPGSGQLARYIRDNFGNIDRQQQRKSACTGAMHVCSNCSSCSHQAYFPTAIVAAGLADVGGICLGERSSVGCITGLERSVLAQQLRTQAPGWHILCIAACTLSSTASGCYRCT